MSKDTGGPAFPIFPDTGGGHAAAFRGMTLRDYFAAKAMQGCVSAGAHDGDFPVIVERAYAVADAMLKARGEK